MNDFPMLLSPMKVGSKIYRNRILAAPYHGPALTEDGQGADVSFNCMELFSGKARGGYAEIALGETNVDFIYANRSPHAIPYDWTDLSEKNLRPWKRYAEAVKQQGAIVVIELMHAGCHRVPNKRTSNEAIGPMGYERPDGSRVIAMDETLMGQVCKSFADCAYFMKMAGYDGVMPHYGHGWLFTQFLSPLTNRRMDEYGGSLENRARFPIRVLKAMRERCGNDFLICPRISGEETVPGGITVEEAAEFVHMLEGLVDMVHISVGDYRDPVRSREFSSCYHSHACNAHLAKYIKGHTTIPVSTVGGISDPYLMEQLLEDGVCDFVALGRGGLAEPELPNKLLNQKASDTNKCLRCYRCYGGPLEEVLARNGGIDPDYCCSVNPCADRWSEIARRPAPTGSRKVLVIGGGFAGMYAAATAAERGHQVILVEESDHLGGILSFSEKDPHKEDIYKQIQTLRFRMKDRGIDVRLNTVGTEDLIKQLAPDAVVLAIGAVPFAPQIPGLEKASHVLAAYDMPGHNGEKVLIVGGGQAGAEAAVYLSSLGHPVTLIEGADEIAKDAYVMHHVALMDCLKQGSVEVRVNTSCEAVFDQGVTVRTAFGTRETLEADLVFYALGMRSRSVGNLKEAAGNRKVFIVGDCFSPRKIVDATREGFDAGMAIL